MGYYLKKFWKINTVTSLFQVLCDAMMVVLSLITVQVFFYIIHPDLQKFIFWNTVNLAGWAAVLILRGIRDFFKSKAIRDMNNQLRLDMAAGLLQKSHQSYHSQDKGEYLSAFTNDVNQIEQLAWRPFFELVGTGAEVICSILALLSFHWSLLAASIVMSFITMNAPNLVKKRMERLGADSAQEQAAATGKLKDLLAGYDVLRFFGKEKRFSFGVSQASNQAELPKYRMNYQKGICNQVIASINIFCQAMLNVLIGVLSIRGMIIQSAMAGTGNICSMISNGMISIANNRLSFAAAKPYFDKITVHAEDQPAQSAEGLSPVREAVAVENLTFRYGEKPILQNAAFRFEKGGKYALTGPSGCGKSTLLKLLLGWLPDYEGTITFDGQDAKAYTPEQLQKQMSYIEQDVFLFNTTIRENITLGEEFTEEQIQKALRDSALAGDLAHMPLGLDTPVGEEGSALSGGQKQRVAIARALIHDRSILLVDEGTSALDQKNADIVEKSLLSNPDLTLILVSHHLTEERKAQFTQVFDLAA